MTKFIVPSPDLAWSTPICLTRCSTSYCTNSSTTSTHDYHQWQAIPTEVIS